MKTILTNSWRLLFVLLCFLITILWVTKIVLADPSPDLTRVPAYGDKPYATILTATPTCTSTPWTVVSSPPLNGSALFMGVASVAADDVWAVGRYNNDNESRGLIEHWDGNRWSTLQVPDDVAGVSLFALSALSSTDIWAIGTENGNETLTIHWNGSNWSRVPSPNNGSIVLEGVTAISHNDVWAVGEYAGANNLTMHWNGIQWSIVTAPNPYPGSDYLHAVAGVATNDVWAVGEANQGQLSTAIHWDGIQWSSVYTPPTGGGGNILRAVAAVASNDVWAMGDTQYGPDAAILHWDGSNWNAAPTAEVQGSPRSLDVVSSSDIWAVGVTLIAHWDGVAWRNVALPPGMAQNQLLGVSAVSADSVWAVGMQYTYYGGQPLVLHYSRQACASATDTPAPTNTPTSTPPVCGPDSNYVLTENGGTIVPGSVLLPGSQCLDCTVNMALPFSYYFYGQPYSSVLIGSNGVINFTGNQNAPFNECIPDAGAGAAIFPYWDHLDTSYNIDPTLGVYTSISGASPNRIFNIEWRACRYNLGSCGGHVNFEARLYENRSRFDLVLNTQLNTNGSATLGVQRDSAGTRYTLYSCDIAYGPPTIFVFSQPSCYTPTVTPTGTLSTATSTPTRTSTPVSTATSTPTITPTGTPACGLYWRLTTAPDPGAVENDIYGMQALSSTDIWSVGTYRGGDGIYQPLAMHWDGSIWSQATVNGINNSVLQGVAGTSSDDVWAVGYSYTNGGAHQMLIEHWNGAVWALIDAPNAGVESALYGIAASGANDVWAVGYQEINGHRHTAVIHWGGQAWSVAVSPNPGSDINELYGVTTISSGDVWAVGGYANTYYEETPLTLHWDGQVWAFVASPMVAGSALHAVSATSSDDVWAVGTCELEQQTVAMHWNGTQWIEIDAMNLGNGSALRGVIALSPNDVWAVGSYFTSITERTAALIEHWDGNAWSIVPAPNPSLPSNSLYAVTAAAQRDLWAGGYYDSPIKPLLAQYSDPCSTPPPTVTGTPPTSTHTLTSVPGTATSTTTPTATATSTCVPYGTLVNSPNESHGANFLQAVTSSAPDDAWTVGYYDDWDRGYGDTLVEHWEGSAWSVAMSPNAAQGNSELMGVTAIAANDVWAVGFSGISGAYRTLVLHYDGLAWSIVPSASQGTQDNQLLSVAALSTADVWAVGYYTSNGFQHTLIEHWDGAMWTVVTSPNTGDDNNQLLSVAALSTADVWAVGYYSVNQDSQRRTLIEHWDGAVWTTVVSPDVQGDYNQLNGVSSAGAADVWAVGSTCCGVGETRPLIEHWDGTAWIVVPSPWIGVQHNFLRSVQAQSPTDVWAAGSYPDDVSGYYEPLMEHWDGSTWSAIAGPSVGLYSNDLYGVAAISPGRAWGVGTTITFDPNNNVYATLTERFVAACSIATTPVPSATPPSVTPTEPGGSPVMTVTGTPTNTITAPPTLTPSGTAMSTGTAIESATLGATSTTQTTGTVVATETATACTISFSDVPQDNTFYANIECLACKGIISGYDDGTFRPNNQVTRGQIAKIVDLSAGIADTSSRQLFEDVPQGSPFYSYVNALTTAGIMGGYPCGTLSGEPCVAPGNLPYFRPNTTATRGQISKIISNAANIQDDAGAQIYTDVPTDNPFYVWINRLSHRGVMGGYACGTIPQEPCDAQNRPYFRPGNTTTRGQASKIDSNTFFPDCQSQAEK